MRTVLLLALAACTGPQREPLDPSPLFGVDETESWRLPGLHGPAYVLRVEANVPHIYATDREDLARVHGFVIARDRFFVLDMARRLSTGRIAALLGDKAIAGDYEARANGMSYVAASLDRTMTAEDRLRNAAFVDGVNAYIEQVRLGVLPAPSEYDLAAPLLGKASPVELMLPFETSDVAAIGATLVYELGFETGDIGNQRAWDALPGWADGKALAELRQDGLYDDVWFPEEPVFPIASADGWQTEGDRGRRPPRSRAHGAPVPKAMIDRLDARLDALQARMGRDHVDGWGSNAWAVTGANTTDGKALLAGDGHLPLSVPSLFYSIGLDTEHLGGGDTHQVGLVFPGMPIMAVGTNGRVAWSQTQLMGDITDWYREELVLDAAGAPAATTFAGDEQPLTAVVETVTVADVPFLDSVGRTETWSRYTTFDGRWIAEIEGDGVDAAYVPAPGETVVRLGDSLVVPADTNDDGKITAISFDYTGLDDGNAFRALDAWGHSADVRELREGTKRLVAYSQNIVAADANGDVLYTGYQAVPCRGYLDREPNGDWPDGSDPSRVLDGTRYGGFEIPLIDGVVDESLASDPYKCVVPFDVYPQSISPDRGYVQSANNDPGGASLDGTLANDPYYIGGPWTEGYRADTIERSLTGLVATQSANVAEMQALQGNHESAMGRQLTPYLLDSIDRAQALALDPGGSPADIRLVALYATDAAAIDEVETRLRAWQAGGYATPSGVETFYHTPVDGEIADAVATSLFQAWMGRFVTGALDDEGFPDVFKPTGGTGRMRLLTKMLDGRGPNNPLGLASYNPDTEESAFWDVLGTEPVETSDEVIVQALLNGLTYLRQPPTSDGRGGYGSADMDDYVWGLRHWVHFDSILKEFLGDDPTFGFLLDQFNITPERLPLAPDLASDDPRRDLPGFPRPGDQFSVDAANPGMGTGSWEYGSGPVFRLVVGLGPDGVTGENILPGGQSGITNSPHFDDQAVKWLANEALPLRFTVDEAVAGAIARESFLPDAPGW